MGLFRHAALCVAVGVFTTPLAAQHAEPLHIRNLNPVVAIFGLPAWDKPAPGTAVGASVEIANHFRFSLRGSDLLILDGETVRTNLSVAHGFANGWTIGAELPYYRIGGGVLDDLIDGWHSAFGLPDGGRNNRPEGELLFDLGDRNGSFLGFATPQSGVGDVQLKAARPVGRDGRFVLQGTVKLATGDVDSLTGSGAVDVGLTLLRAQALPGRPRPAGYFWGLGVLRVGEPDRIAFDVESMVYTAIVGGSWQPWPKFGLKAQLDFHTAVFNTQLEELGEDAIQATFGAWRPVGRRGTVEFALVEDLEVSTAPDVVVQVAAKWQW